MPIKTHIRTIEDHPKPGIQFRDITTLLKDPVGFRLTIQELEKHYRGLDIDKVAGIESRGFIIGAPLAFALGVGFIPIRKQGKLPAKTKGQDYDLEYGSDRVEVHIDAIEPNDKVLVVDDLIATGGTAKASIDVLEALGAHIVECAFVIDLPDLGGHKKLEEHGYKVHTLCAFEGH